MGGLSKGFENENLTKPEECSAINEDNTFTPDQVSARAEGLRGNFAPGARRPCQAAAPRMRQGPWPLPRPQGEEGLALRPQQPSGGMGTPTP